MTGKPPRPGRLECFDPVVWKSEEVPWPPTLCEVVVVVVVVVVAAPWLNGQVVGVVLDSVDMVWWEGGGRVVARVVGVAVGVEK